MTETSEKSFLRPGKVLLLLLLALLVYAMAVVFWVPAGWLWERASPQIDLPAGLQVNRVAGTLWQGRAQVSVQRRPVHVTWALSWPDLIELRQPLDVSLATAHSRISGQVQLTWPGSVVADAHGHVHVPEFEDLIRQSGGAILQGDVTVDRLRIAANDSGLESATGLGRWAGGEVSWPAGDQRLSATFPPMQATLVDSTRGVLLTVAEQGVADPAADAAITFDGMLEVRVYKRMVDLAGQQWSAAAAPGDVIFQVQQPLLPGGRR